MVEIVCPSVILYSSIELSWRHDSWTAALVAIDSGSRQNKVKKERKMLSMKITFLTGQFLPHSQQITVTSMTRLGWGEYSQNWVNIEIHS